MSPKVDTDDLIDARTVADLLELAQPNSVSLYQNRYPDMPRPVINMGQGRCRLWSKSEMVRWAKKTGRLK